MRRPTQFFAILTLLLATGCGESKPDAVADDLTRLCSGLTAMEGHEFADGFARSRAMQEVLTSAIREEATREFMGSLAARGSSAERMSALKTFAGEHGLPHYECPALD